MESCAARCEAFLAGLAGMVSVGAMTSEYDPSRKAEGSRVSCSLDELATQLDSATASRMTNSPTNIHTMCMTGPITHNR